MTGAEGSLSQISLSLYHIFEMTHRLKECSNIMKEAMRSRSEKNLFHLLLPLHHIYTMVLNTEKWL